MKKREFGRFASEIYFLNVPYIYIQVVGGTLLPFKKNAICRTEIVFGPVLYLSDKGPPFLKSPDYRAKSRFGINGSPFYVTTPYGYVSTNE